MTVQMYACWSYDQLQNSNNNACQLDYETEITQQQFREEADINYLISRYGVHGLYATHKEGDDPLFMDVSDVPTDLMTAIQKVNDANSRLNELPAALRKKFDDDPVAMYEFISNSDNIPEAIQMGILPPEPLPPLPDFPPAPITTQSTTTQPVVNSTPATPA